MKMWWMQVNKAKQIGLCVDKWKQQVLESSIIMNESNALHLQ